MDWGPIIAAANAACKEAVDKTLKETQTYWSGLYSSSGSSRLGSSFMVSSWVSGSGAEGTIYPDSYGDPSIHYATYGRGQSEFFAAWYEYGRRMNLGASTESNHVFYSAFPTRDKVTAYAARILPANVRSSFVSHGFEG